MPIHTSLPPARLQNQPFNQHSTGRNHETQNQRDADDRRNRLPLRFKGDTLVIECTSEDGFFKRKIALSADGKTITKTVTQSPRDGEQTEDTVVFEKQ
jgi:hypothetical protein